MWHPATRCAAGGRADRQRPRHGQRRVHHRGHHRGTLGARWVVGYPRMIFGRRPEKRPALLHYERILVPLGGTEADETALRLTAMLLSGSRGVAQLLHVIEVPFERKLDEEDPVAVTFADEILGRGETFLAEQQVEARTSVVQARAAGAAIVDDAAE